jgi:hypothetical protein
VRRYLEEHPSEDGGRLGRLVNHDPRSRAYRLPRSGSVLRDVHHQSHVSTLDQGSLGSCVPNSGTTVLGTETYWWTLDEGTQAALGEPWAVDLYREVTRNDPWPGSWEPTDTGSDGLSLAKVLVARGTIAGYQHAFDPASALGALQEQPLITGIAWRSGCDRPNVDGLVSWSGPVRGGHEIAVTGYLADKQWVEFRNSWGTGWGVGSHFSGEHGYFYMTVADWAQALTDDGDVTAFVPITQPPPEPVLDPELEAWWKDTRDWIEHPHGWHRSTVAAIAARQYAGRKGLV